ncbi:hypothetical protein FVA96_24240 [Escherichia coli]|nr:hypothetical protein [Escherichia coli]
MGASCCVGQIGNVGGQVTRAIGLRAVDVGASRDGGMSNSVACDLHVAESNGQTWTGQPFVDIFEP